MKVHPQKNHAKKRRRKPAPKLEVIPAPTIYWHPSISLEKLISDLAEYRDSLIVS
jgi:hypothetical protein